ncbi:MAG: chromosome segregation protein SMC [Acidobacteriota bacterium]
MAGPEKIYGVDMSMDGDMLKIDWLQLAGFKSFADKTLIRFEQGINGIVGPNGCGKSNLADALGWVLGSGTAASLRGEKMDDVIFAGTRKRRPSGVVSATLCFSRIDGGPITLKEPEFSGDTLEISRKLYRSGESVYSINQRRCRLKDIRSLLDEAGLGFASYALIAQGNIGWFLRAKPVERRTLIEEAARISGYKSRRRSAELKLELTRQNLLRVNDIVSEIERRLRSLKRQAAKARSYQRVKERFRLIQRQKLTLESNQLQEQLQTLVHELEQLRTTDQDLSQELTVREEAHDRALEKREELESRLSELRQGQSEIRLEIDRTENSIQYHEEQIEMTRKGLRVSDSEQQVITQSLEKIQQELDNFQSERMSLAEEERKVVSAIQDQTELVARHEEEIGQAETRTEEFQNRLVQVSAAIAALDNLKGQLEQQIKLAHINRARLEKERAQHALEWEESESSLKKARQSHQDKQTQTAQLQEKLQVQGEKQRELESRAEETKEELGELQKQLIAQQERLHSLEEIELSHANYSEGVQQLLTHLNSSQTIRTSGTLADCIETNPKYERLVEDFLDEELEYILVDSLKEAATGISELKTLESGRGTFLTLSSSNGFDDVNGQQASRKFSESGVHGTLSDLLQMSPNVKKAFHRTLPHRAAAIVVSDLDRAFQLAHQYPENTLITLEGESLTPRGLLSASTVQAKKLGLLTLKRKKRELESRIHQVQKQLSTLQARDTQQQAELQEASQLFQGNEAALLSLEKEIIGLNHRVEQGEKEETQQQRALQVIEEELAGLAVEHKQQTEKLKEVDDNLNQKKGTYTSDEKLLSETQKTLQQLRVEFERLREQLHLVTSDHKVLGERNSALERTLHRIEEQRTGLLSQEKATQASQRQNNERLQKMTQDLETLKIDLVEHGQKAEQLNSALSQQELASAQWKEHFPRTEKELGELRIQKSELRERRSEVDVDKARAETQLQNISEQCEEQLQMSLEKAVAETDLTEITSEEDVHQAYGELKERLETFGPLNMAALQEYQESEERHQFLTSQLQDIEGSIADTTRAIQEINRRSRKQFQEAFDTINASFTEIFQKLFGGGECGMRLLDEEDLLESGIDIYAQPPGKKLQNVRLLSGGEEALTVFSLLMGIFNYRPSRFCVLDEVDAPLDDSNVTRFTNLIQEMSSQTQFIVITHNKHTMKTSNTLYGVTMEEAGVSQLVSVKL